MIGVIVSCYFNNKKEDTALKFTVLNKIKAAIETHFLTTQQTFIAVDTSWDKISSFVDEYPEYFEYNENYTAIRLKKQLDENFKPELDVEPIVFEFLNEFIKYE